jgi:DNA polymerase-1
VTASATAEKATEKSTLMLLDGNSLAFRAFYALPAENFKTQGGLTTNAVYGFTAMLINLLRDEQPSHIAAAFDVSRQTFRLEKYPEYKAGRSATPDEFRGQIDITKEVLGALGITVLAEAGFEADDVIATLATQAEDAGYRVLVVSGDRDSLQLVSDDVTVLYPRWRENRHEMDRRVRISASVGRQRRRRDRQGRRRAASEPRERRAQPRAHRSR